LAKRGAATVARFGIKSVRLSWFIHRPLVLPTALHQPGGLIRAPPSLTPQPSPPHSSSLVVVASAAARRLTTRWTTGPTTAGCLGPAWGTRYIFPTRAKPSRRSGPV